MHNVQKAILTVVATNATNKIGGSSSYPGGGGSKSQHDSLWDDNLMVFAHGWVV